jgi:galactokinase/mevalonate kinase-like predicted kinase
LFHNMSMVWTQQSRQANSVLSDQEKRSEQNEINLDNLKEAVYQLRDEIRSGEPSLRKIGELIGIGWELKKLLSPLILTPTIEALFDEINTMEIFGNKLLGAGAGGFVLSIHKNLSDDLDTLSHKWAAFCPRLDHAGARVLSSN